MDSPKVSVIIPAYNGAKYLGEAIQSVLHQTYSNFELLVVDDASTDDTSNVIRRFRDVRIKYILHSENRGAVAARATGVRTSTGEIIAFLDQDDLFHPAKLATHVAFLARHPKIGLTYNSRFELRDSSKTICGLWRPPHTLSLADLVVGFPISPSDTVVRRSWASGEHLWDDRFSFEGDEVIFNGHEIVFGARLALAGCRFGHVGRALNYRRFHPDRRLTNIKARCRAELACQDLVFSDPRCPAEILALRNTAFANLHLMWAFEAFFQGEAPLGQELLRSAVQLKPSLLQDKPAGLIEALAVTSSSCQRNGFEGLLRSVFTNLPPELAQLREQHDWALARGCLLKATQATIWDRTEDARTSFVRASELGAEIDESFVQTLTALLMDYEAEFGGERSQALLQSLIPNLKKFGGRRILRKFKANYCINQAFDSSRIGDHRAVTANVLRGISNDLSYLTNRGVLAILLRSLSRVRI